MTDHISDAQQADRLSGRRARTFIVLAGAFLVQQAAFFGTPSRDRLDDLARISAWILLAAVLLAALLSGGFWLKPRALRALMEDEVTRANRASAVTLGFAVMTGSAIALYALLPLVAMTARETIHALVSLGLVSGLIRFAILERRALG